MLNTINSILLIAVVVVVISALITLFLTAKSNLEFSKKKLFIDNFKNRF